MNIFESYKTCFVKYADFKGKASRSEYWWFWLIYMIILFGLPILAFITDLQEPTFGAIALTLAWSLGSLGLLCPFLAVSVRRLHDSGLSGWHFLWRFIPYVGSLISIVLMLRKSR